MLQGSKVRMGANVVLTGASGLGIEWVRMVATGCVRDLRCSRSSLANGCIVASTTLCGCPAIDRCRWVSRQWYGGVHSRCGLTWRYLNMSDSEHEERKQKVDRPACSLQQRPRVRACVFLTCS